jgi:hypothetical protein
MQFNNTALTQSCLDRSHSFDGGDRRCAACGQLMHDHPPHHRFCRRCYGYGLMHGTLRVALADLQAERP